MTARPRDRVEIAQIILQTTHCHGESRHTQIGLGLAAARWEPKQIGERLDRFRSIRVRQDRPARESTATGKQAEKGATIYSLGTSSDPTSTSSPRLRLRCVVPRTRCVAIDRLAKRKAFNALPSVKRVLFLAETTLYVFTALNRIFARIIEPGDLPYPINSSARRSRRHSHR